MKPDFFVVGAAKAGTTALYHYLKQHPEIYMSPIKEPHHFCKDIRLENFRDDYRKRVSLNTEIYFRNRPLPERHIAFISNLTDYEKLFEVNVNAKRAGEVSNGYLFSDVAAQEIFKYNPKSKIIIVLREPVERTLSHYFMDLAIGLQEQQDILKGIKADYGMINKGWGVSHLYIELSQYVQQVERYLNVFPRDQLMIMNYNELNEHPEKFMKRIFNFLEVKTAGIKINFSERFNRTMVPKNGLVRFMTKRKLYLPSLLSDFFKKRKSILLKPHTVSMADVRPETKKYIENLVYSDWSLCLSEYLSN